MGALPMLNPWLPQDDLLLKKSIEGGASLESLARGAVEFSREFSIKELQDRWKSLLYDPAVSAEACAQMAKFEISTVLSKSKKAKECKLGNGKRKHESIRSCYYAMRKRVCNGPLYQGDLSFLVDNSFVNEIGENDVEDPLGNDFELEDCNFDGLYNVSASLLGNDFFIGQENMLEDPVDQKTTITDRGHLGYSSPMPEMPTWKTVDNMLLQERPNDINDHNDVGEGLLEDTDIQLQPVLTNDMLFDDFDTSTGCPDDYFADIVDFSLTNEDEMYMKDDGNDGIDDTCHWGIETLLSNTLTGEIDADICNIPEVNKPASVVLDKSGMILVKGDAAEFHTSESNYQSCSVNQTSFSHPPFTEYQNGVICCVFNTEDLEIPSNDDVIFPAKKPTNGHRRTQSKATVPSSSAKGNIATQAIENIKKSHSTQSFDVGLNCAASGRVIEIETQGHGDLCQMSMAIKNENPDFSDCDVTEKSGQMVEPHDVQRNDGVINQEAQQMPSMLKEGDNERVASENKEQNSDSDADMPCVSVVESMILDMDLGPADREASCAQKVEKYQQEDAMKEIVRLEQIARSYMQREMASHGAFAKLFGHHSKHYIKKPEILLGRATGGVHVDIDLTREGPSKKISRRQASIKMDRIGTFRLKNLGQCPIYVNDEEISQGQCVNLSSNCLIEIRGLAFIFQVNHQQVKLYLDSVVR